MVFGNVRDLKDYGYLEEEVLKCFAYAKEHDLLAFERVVMKLKVTTCL